MKSVAGICLKLTLAALPGATVAGVAYAVDSEPLATIELTCVDPDVRTNSGTFHSHNQKVIQNARGIFMTHARTRNPNYTAQEWRLSWSRDGGRTFTTLLTATHATSPGTLETDAEGNLYMGRPDFSDKQAYLYRLLASEDYREPHITRIPNGSGGKYAMMLDAPRRQIYWISHNRTFSRLDLEGRVLSTGNLFAGGLHAVVGYPHLSLDSKGVLHAAWTTVMVPAPRPAPPIYWDIHYMQSPDGGLTWHTMAGAPISVPVAADNSGPTDRINLDDEYGGSNWLANMFVKEDKAHFMYRAQKHPARQHYIRYDLPGHRRDLDLHPTFAGRQLSISGKYGFFAGPKVAKDATLYCVGEDARASTLVCLVSPDNGATWHDYAASEKVDNPYAIGGAREITPDGWIIGSFTELLNPRQPASPSGPARVYFYRIRASGKRQSS